jgi:hypothetical protein
MPGNPHVRFDERGWETGRRFGVSARAHPRLYKLTVGKFDKLQVTGIAVYCPNAVAPRRNVGKQLNDFARPSILIAQSRRFAARHECVHLPEHDAERKRKRQLQAVLRQSWDMWWSGGPAGSSTGIWAWDASKSGTRLSKWWPPRTDFATILSPAILKARARDADRHNPWAHRALNLLRDYVVSTGIVPMVDTADTPLRARTHPLWTAWTETADFTGRHGFYTLQGQAFRSCLIDGEIIGLIRPGRMAQHLISEHQDGASAHVHQIHTEFACHSDAKAHV